jgi:hypothetical protein
MEFNLDKSNNSDIINYSYQINTIYKENIEKTIENDHYIKLSFPSKYPNISSSILDSNYKSSNIYISKKMHSIKGIDFDGELIIEHIPITNGFTKFYVCIPLKTVTGYHTIIDDLIKNKQAEINIMSLLPTTSTGILYSSSIFSFETPFANKVLLFTEPILIRSSFSSFETIDLFSIFSQNYDIVTIKKYNSIEIEGFQEGLETTANLYCQPVDINDASNNDILTVALPTGKPSDYDGTNQMMSLTQNFMVFFVILLGIFGLTPFAYDLIIGLINAANKSLNQNLKPKDKAGILFGFDIMFSLILFLISVCLMYLGISDNSPSLISIGFFMFLSFAFIFIRVQLYKSLAFPGGFVEFINEKFLSTQTDKLSDTDIISPDLYMLIIDPVNTIIERGLIFVFFIFVMLFAGLAVYLNLMNNSKVVTLIIMFISIVLSFIFAYYAAIFTKKKEESSADNSRI